MDCDFLLRDELRPVRLLLELLKPELIQKELSAKELIKQWAQMIGGSGGGKVDTAQAGGKDLGQIDAVFTAARKLLESLQ